jgi:hypothetical protein
LPWQGKQLATWENALSRFTGGQVVAGSNPVSPTKVLAGERRFRGDAERPLDLDSGLDRNAHDGDLIMVGSSWLSAPKRLFLGSTSAKMLRVLDVPMVIVPRPVDAQMNAVDLTGAQIRGAVFQRESDAGRH